MNGLLRRWAISVGAILCLLWIVSRKTFFSDTISSPFLGVAIFSIFLILLRTRRDLRELGLVAVLSLVQYILDIHWLGYPYNWPVIGSFVGIAGLGVLVLRTIWAADSERKVAVLTVIPALLFVVSEWCASYFLQWGERARPKTLDLYLYSFDASLHIQPAFLVGQWFTRVHAFAVTSQVIYLALPVAIGLVFAGCVVRDRTNAIPAVIAFLITGPIGACFYSMFPALGPVHIFRDGFPWHPLTIDQARRLFLEPIPVPGPRNAIPSLHAAWIFLVYWYARKLSLAERIGAGIFVFFTLCATLGTGEHYFVDLVVAAPFTVMIVTVTHTLLAKPNRMRWMAFLYGLGTTLGWFAMLRYATQSFWTSPAIPWLAMVLTLASSWYVLRGAENPALETLVTSEVAADQALV